MTTRNKTNGFITSPRFKEILTFIRDNRSRMTKKEMYAGVKKIDPEVPTIHAFFKFLLKIENDARTEVQLMHSLSHEMAKTDLELVQFGIKRAMALGNIVLAQTLEEVQQMVEKGDKIPHNMKKDIMSWYKQGGDLMFQEQTLKLKRVDTALNVERLAVLTRSARSGNLTPDDVAEVTGEIVEGEIESMNNQEEYGQSETIQQDE